MPTPTFSADNCTPRLITIEPSDGCSLTRAQIRPFTKADFEAQGFKEVGMDSTIAMTKEARLIGVPQRGLTDLLLSRHTPYREGGTSGKPHNGSIIAPYTLVPQRRVVNANYFHVEAYSATLPSGITKGTHHPQFGYVPSSAANLTINNGVDVNNKLNFNTSLKNIERYFLPGHMVVVESLAFNMNGGTPAGATADDAVTISFQIVAAVPHASDPTKAQLVVAPNLTETGWNALTSAQKAMYSPAKGLLIILANSVSDYERYCYQFPAVNPNNLIEYWAQTVRWSHSYSDEYLAALNAPLTSEYFKRFRQIPLAEQRRQQEMLQERAFYNTVFYGERINENQSLANWTSLPTVEDPNLPGCVLEYKANTLGMRTQLGGCGRVQDRKGLPLQLDTLFETCYLLKRERENTGGSVAVIDAMTDRFTASQIRDLMIGYYKKKYNSDFNIYIQAGQKLIDSITKKVVFEYNMYDLPDQGVSLAVFADPYFDDRLGAAPVMGTGTADNRRQKSIWLIDWTDFDIVQHHQKAVRRRTNVLDDLYNCVIQPNIHHYFLNSKKFEVRLGDPNRHVLIENFSTACPTLAATVCAVT